MNVESTFRLAPFRLPGSTLPSPKRGGGRIGVQYNVALESRSNGGMRIEQNFVLRGIEKSWVGFRIPDVLKYSLDLNYV